MKQRTRTILALTFAGIAFILYWISTAILKHPLPAVNHLQIGYYNENQVLIYSIQIPATATRYTACGILESQNPEDLDISLLDVENNLYVGGSNAGDEIKPGDFCVNLIIKRTSLSSGNYELEVRNYHELIARLPFVMK